MSDGRRSGVPTSFGLSLIQRITKRSFDVIGAVAGLVIVGWIIVLAYAIACLDTHKSGFFTQPRVGRGGKLFPVIKIRTMRAVAGIDTTVTAGSDPRITRIGRFFRRTKIDELPQLLNILAGHMSFVGPRPDVPGFADRLTGDDRVILAVRPGITGPATLNFRHEEQLLAAQRDPEDFNREVLFPEKVRINREYVQNYSFTADLIYIWRTLFG